LSIIDESVATRIILRRSSRHLAHHCPAYLFQPSHILEQGVGGVWRPGGRYTFVQRRVNLWAYMPEKVFKVKSFSKLLFSFKMKA
jgi:hypothetical protein